jgi:tRNA(fMet)-specific endonuclease VapC
VRILLDTNRLTDVFRGDAALIRIVESARVVWLPFIALAEIKAGFLAGKRAAANEVLLLAFLQLPHVDVVYADHETTEVYARLFLQLRRAGRPIPTNDLWIASLAVQHQLVLVSRDEHFGKLPQILKA